MLIPKSRFVGVFEVKYVKGQDLGSDSNPANFSLASTYTEGLSSVIKVNLKDKKKVQKKLDLFGSPIFSDEWWGNTKDDSIDNDRTNTTTEEIYTF